MTKTKLKYGNNIIFRPETLHSRNIDRQTVQLIDDGSRVLEIGCATGFMGEYLIRKKHCFVTGIDMRNEEIQQARKVLSEVIQGDIEDMSLQRKITKNYDVILASALVQHLKEPEKALKIWKSFLKNDGRLIITASNIAHWTTRLQLLRGNFDYTPYGLLDDTHLRFFTIKTFKKLLTDAGYTIEYFSIDAVGGGYPKISRFLSYIFPSLFAYQMVIKARPI